MRSRVRLRNATIKQQKAAAAAAAVAAAAAAQRRRRKFNAYASHNILRPISLLQAMNADDLLETVQIAFGNAPVREGGPVNLAMRVN
jgi:MYXO-CTERM domain-containing protein